MNYVLPMNLFHDYVSQKLFIHKCKGDSWFFPPVSRAQLYSEMDGNCIHRGMYIPRLRVLMDEITHWRQTRWFWVSCGVMKADHISKWKSAQTVPLNKPGTYTNRGNTLCFRSAMDLLSMLRKKYCMPTIAQMSTVPSKMNRIYPR